MELLETLIITISEIHGRTPWPTSRTGNSALALLRTVDQRATAYSWGNYLAPFLQSITDSDSCMHSFIHSFIRSFVHSRILAFVHSLIHALMRLRFHGFLDSLVSWPH